MALQLERLGVDIIEAGFPIASPGDFEAVRAISEAVRGAKVAALCRAKAKDIEAAGQALEGAVQPGHPHLPRHLRHPPEVEAPDHAGGGAEAGRRGREARPDVLRRGGVLGRGRLALGLRVPEGDPPGRLRGGGAHPQRARHRGLRAAPGVRGHGPQARPRHPGRRHLGPLPQRPRPGGGQLPGRRPGRRAPGRVHDQRHRRARGQHLARGARDGAQGAPRGPAGGHGGEERAADADQHAAVDRDRRVAAAEQGHRRPQRLRPRGGHPPARHARQPALLRDHDPGERGPFPVDAHPREALGEARRRVAPQAARRRPEAGATRSKT